MALTSLQLDAHSQLDAVLASKAEENKTFEDSDGLISFANLASSFVENSPEFKTGREVCDKISNFFSRLRTGAFQYLIKDPSHILPGDTPPKTKWDPAVTHFMQHLLSQAGGLTNYTRTEENFSYTQLLSEFSTDFVKLLFDATVIPEAIITDIVKFVSGIGDTLRVSWNDRSRSYSIALLGQCHEAIPIGSGDTAIYYPKIKYYYISVNSSQKEFTSPCSKLKKITFNFEYSYYVTGLAASVLDTKSHQHKDFVSFLDQAQVKSYKEAKNVLSAIISGKTSDKNPPGMFEKDEHGLNIYGVDLLDYPKILIQPSD